MSDTNNTPNHEDIEAKLTAKQKQFCREYIIDLNITRAAKAAGYSKKTANRTGSENLTKPVIQEYIKWLKTQNIQRVANEDEMDYSADTILREAARMAMFRPEDFVTFVDTGKKDEKTGKPLYEMAYTVTPENVHKLRGISGIKVKEARPVTIVEAGIEIERDVIEFEFKSEKAKGIEMMMKHHGLLKEKVEVEGLSDLITELQRGRERVAKMKPPEQIKIDGENT